MAALVSVVVPSIGRACVANAMDSVRRQDAETEVILVDDRPAGAGERDWGPDVRVVRTTGRVGAAQARNLGMQAARGSFIAFLDDDDVWLPGHLESAYRTLTQRPDAAIYASRGLVVDEAGSGRIEPAVLVGDRGVAEYFFEPATWWSRSRRILTPTLVFRSALRTHLMESHRASNEDTWWLLTAERELGARLVQSAHVGVLVHASTDRMTARQSGDLARWLADIEALRPGAAAAELLRVRGRPAARDGDPRAVIRLGRDIAARPRGWRWWPVVGAHAAAATAVAARRRTRPVGHA